MDKWNKMTKVLIITNKMMHYRVPIFNLLARKCDLTVAYSEGDLPKDISFDFKILKLPIWTFFGRWVVHKANIAALAGKYDVVIPMMNITWLTCTILPFLPFRRFKVVPWGIGVSASYNKRFDADRRLDFFRKMLYKASDAVIFYSRYPIGRFSAKGVPKEKLFSANNTVEVEESASDDMDKDSLLFIGSVVEYKGLGRLLRAYKKVCEDGVPLPVLNIVGTGKDFENTKKWIEQNALSDKIYMRGAIYSVREKAGYFRRALALFSPNQAGLAVQEGMGYGVPMVTDNNSYTGGERLDIKDQVTGVLLGEKLTLEDVLKDIASNPQKYAQMGNNAKQFYNECRKPSDMADNFMSAINYAASH